MKAIATAPNKPTKYIELTQVEIDQRAIEEQNSLDLAKTNYPRILRDKKLYSEINIGGVLITPDDITQQRIMAARIIAKEDPSYTVNWKTNSGYISLDANTIIAISDAIRAHVQKCFDAEKTVSDNIGNYATLEDIGVAYDAAYST